MGRKRYSAEEVVNKLRHADVELAKGQTVAAVCKLLGIKDQSYFRWRKEYDGLRGDRARRFKELEQENARHKRLLADAEPDKAILKEAAREKF
jgi:transposase-like protein